MRVKIESFKSIEQAELVLAPLTILLGPPAGGKSNILDAIAFAGYFGRLLTLEREYDNNAGYLEPLTTISRFTEYGHLFRNYDLTKRISIEIGDEDRIRLSISYEQGRASIKLNDTVIPWDPASKTGDIVGARNLLLKLLETKRPAKKPVEARLYGYDRYGLGSTICRELFICGFSLRLKNIPNMSTIQVPKSILSELGWNAPSIVRALSDVITRINRVVAEHLDKKVEIKVLRSGSVVIFDYDYEVDVYAAPDSILRTLYYSLAMRSAANYAKLYGLEGRLIVLLEEPEAHVFPYFLQVLSEYIAAAKDTTLIVIATHNPILVSMLWDKVKDVKTYYVVRDQYGSTRVWEVDMEKLASDLKTSEDLLFASPREVISKYVVGKRE